MRLFTLPAGLVAALVSAIVVVPFLPEARTQRAVLMFEVRLGSSSAGRVQIFYNTGAGYSEGASAVLPLARSATPLLYRLPLPAGVYHGLRFDPIDHDGTVTIESLRIIRPDGSVWRTLSFSELRPAHQIAAMRERDGRLEVVTESDANDPQLSLTFNPPIEARSGVRELMSGLGLRALGVFATLVVVLLALDFAPRRRAALAAAARRLGTRPGRAIAMVAAIAVIASAYPVVFLGKSFVSPNGGTLLLYDGYPTLPGYGSRDFVDVRGSDVNAVLWAHVGYSMVAHRALARGELPLWNRYNSAGTPLLGQGQSMFGDPLHLFVILCDGAAWAWDIKYLVAKWLFAVGLGLLVFAVARDLPSALIVSAVAPFIGFFVFRLNHPAIFSLSYAPWALYCWLRVAQAVSRPATTRWAAGLMLANLALLGSGTVKEAWLLLLTMNFSGACVLLAANAPWRTRLAKLAALAWAGALFALLTAPLWATFLHTLGNARTAYTAAGAYQLPPSLLLGAFDELFYRPVAGGYVLDPSLNFLLLLGLLYFLATLRRNLADRIVAALAASSIVPLAFAFGLVPASWIMRAPFLGNVMHIDNCFLCALIVLWSVLAGVGFAQAARRLGTAEGRGDLVAAGLLLFALVFAWIANRQVALRLFGAISTLAPLRPGETIPVAPFIWGSLAALLAASAGLAWAVRRSLVRGVFTPAVGLFVALCAVVMLWRHGMQAAAVGFENYTVRPTGRADFHASSDAVSFLRGAQAREPSRGFGLDGNFFPGWTGVYGLETIYSADALVSPFLRELVDLLPGASHDWRLTLAPENIAAARPFFDALNVRYYLDRARGRDRLGPSLHPVAFADLDVYESPGVWPRAFFTDRLALYDEAPDFVQQIDSGDGRPFAAAQRKSAADTPAPPTLAPELAGRAIVPASEYRLTENTTSFTVRASTRGVIVLTETFWPGDFRAELNGRKAPVLRLNHAFKGVAVEAAGDYRVTFRCVPKNFPRNLLLSALGAVLSAASLILALRARDSIRRRPDSRTPDLPARPA